MAPSVSLVVPYEPAAGRRPRDLQAEVRQIVHQKGAFRKVTEQSLLDEIRRPEAPSVEDTDVKDDQDDESETAEAANERLWQRRMEMQGRVA